MRCPSISSQSAFFLFFAVALCFLTSYVLAQQQTPSVPDKDLCAKMLRFGQQSYERGKYLNAKEYFRKAIQADPGSVVAWIYYDRATLFALAEKVEKNASLIAPDVSTRAEEGQSKVISPVPAPPKAGPVEKKKFVIVEDEGC